MFSRNDPRKTRLVRGVILRLVWVAANGEALNRGDPYTMSAGVLNMALDEMREHPGEIELCNALRYLEQKGYVKVQWSPTERGAWEAVTLCTAGIDIVEDTVRDAGVLVPRLGR